MWIKYLVVKVQYFLRTHGRLYVHFWFAMALWSRYALQRARKATRPAATHIVPTLAPGASAGVSCGRIILCNDRAFQINAWFCADMLHAAFPFVAKVIVTEAVHFRVDDLVQGVLQLPELRGVNETFKHRILHALTIVFAFLGNPA